MLIETEHLTIDPNQIQAVVFRDSKSPIQVADQGNFAIVHFAHSQTTVPFPEGYEIAEQWKAWLKNEESIRRQPNITRRLNTRRKTAAKKGVKK